ncbi:SCO3870 family protein [Streptomyces sp. NPDC004561]
MAMVVVTWVRDRRQRSQ